jgi:hypothetical protein
MRVARRRQVGRSVVRTAATTAVIAGTAGAVRHHQDQKYAEKDAAAQQQAYYEQQMYEQQMAQQQMQQQPAPAAPAGNDLTSQLQQLSQLHNAGVLNDEEFAAAKAKLLGS